MKIGPARREERHEIRYQADITGAEPVRGYPKLFRPDVITGRWFKFGELDPWQLSSVRVAGHIVRQDGSPGSRRDWCSWNRADLTEAPAWVLNWMRENTPVGAATYPL